MQNISQIIKRNWLWFFYFLFLVAALVLQPNYSNESYFFSKEPYGFGKTLLWLIWFLFLIYSLKISFKENFFKSLRTMFPILWTRQIGLDLYIGLLVSLFIIFLHDGLVVMLLWLVPILLFANLATLIYFALHYEALVMYFTSSL